MTTFTFDTAYIVASMQNTCNEAVKTVIRDRLNQRTMSQRSSITQQHLGWHEFELACRYAQPGYRERFDRTERALDEAWDSQCAGWGGMADRDDEYWTNHPPELKECPWCGSTELRLERARYGGRPLWVCDPCEERAWRTGF